MNTVALVIPLRRVINPLKLRQSEIDLPEALGVMAFERARVHAFRRCAVLGIIDDQLFLNRFIARSLPLLAPPHGELSGRRSIRPGKAMVIVGDPRQLGLGTKTDLPACDQICFGRAVEERVENRLRDPHTYDWTRSGCRQIAGARRARYRLIPRALCEWPVIRPGSRPSPCGTGSGRQRPLSFTAEVRER
jgi:hypothetical protein